MTQSATSHGRRLIDIARRTIEQAVHGDDRQEPADSDASCADELQTEETWLHQTGATFVTVRRGGELRGCVGSLEAHRTLIEDLRHNARAAVLHDPRFQPLSHGELDEIEIEVSLLSSLEPVPCASQADAVAQLRPGRDGVVLEHQGRRGTFLPQVWESLPSPEMFLARLKEKIGFEAGFWHPEMRLFRYTVSKWRQSDFLS